MVYKVVGAMVYKVGGAMVYKVGGLSQVAEMEGGSVGGSREKERAGRAEKEQWKRGCVEGARGGRERCQCS